MSFVQPLPSVALDKQIAKSAVTRLSVQVVSSRSLVLSSTRFLVQVIANPPVPIRVTRLAIQAVSSNPIVREVTRMAIQTIALHRIETRVTRLAIQAVSENTLTPLEITRLSVNILATAPSKRLINPKKIPHPAPDYNNVNWRENVEITTSWQTDIVKSQISDTEDRRSISSRPIRTVRGLLSEFSQDLSSRYHAWMARRTKDDFPFPLFSDRTKLDLLAPAKSRVLVCDASYRRFFRGARLAVFKKLTLDEQPSEDIFYTTIDLVFDDRIVISEGLPRDYAKGSDVVPLIDAQVSLIESAEALTDEHLEAHFEASETLGGWTLPSLSSKNLFIFEEYKNTPIFPYRLVNWGAVVSLGFKRQGERTFSGRDVFTSLHGEIPKASYEFTSTGLTRRKIFEVLTFFDLVRGRYRKFYMIAPQTNKLDISSWPSLNTVSIKRIGDIENAREVIKNLAFVMKSGKTHIHEVAFIIERDRKWDIVLTENYSFTTGDVEYLTLSHKVRMSTDEIVENWITDELCSVNLSQEEVIDERDHEILDL